MTQTSKAIYPLPSSVRSSLVFTAIALGCFFLADLDINTRTPWQELAKMAGGFVSPSWLPISELLSALAKTLAFALVAVMMAAALGFFLCLQFSHPIVRVFCASTRAVHELFWGLLFIQLFGLHPIVGVLAIAIPYSGIFAKVFAEILEESSNQKVVALPLASDRISQFCYGKWPRVKQHFASYTRYRLECGLRSSTVLGFIGLPSLGFHLESGFMQGDYGMVAALLLIFYGLIASIPLWAKFRLMPIYLGLSIAYLWTPTTYNSALLQNLLTDAIPKPLRTGQGELWPWLSDIAQSQIVPGAWNTLLITQLTLVITGVFALLVFPLLSRQFTSFRYRLFGHSLMVVLRSTPEIILAFLFLLLWGPSMLPAVAALTLHNGAIVSHLMARHSNELKLRQDANTGLNRYLYEVLPRIYGQFLAFLCYRWEVIMRESAIVGILGIHTLGFFIDSAFESFRMDVALLLIGVSAAMNIGVDQLARTVRRNLHLNKTMSTRPC